MNVNRLRWSDHLQVGVPAIDDGHRELIDLYNRIVWVCRNEQTRTVICERIRSFLAYAQQHFRSEEQYMREVHYPEYVPHKADHDRLLQDGEDFIENLHTSAEADDAVAVVLYFKYWLMRHMTGMDSAFARFHH